MSDLRANQLGKFLIDTRFIRTEPQLVSEVFKLMSPMAIVHAEYLYDRDAIEYIAICHLFGEIGEAAAAPYYRIIGQWSIDEFGDQTVDSINVYCTLSDAFVFSGMPILDERGNDEEIND